MQENVHRYMRMLSHLIEGLVHTNILTPSRGFRNQFPEDTQKYIEHIMVHGAKILIKAKVKINSNYVLILLHYCLFNFFMWRHIFLFFLFPLSFPSANLHPIPLRLPLWGFLPTYPIPLQFPSIPLCWSISEWRHISISWKWFINNDRDILMWWIFPSYKANDKTFINTDDIFLMKSWLSI